ncbi:MAG: neuraminidase-like domain-containing protein [Desulfobacteraceae bacterium]|nr:neuraminidase-like domain-containing protein [Desulfobacteraceae bacterium]
MVTKKGDTTGAGRTSKTGRIYKKTDSTARANGKKKESSPRPAKSKTQPDAVTAHHVDPPRPEGEYLVRGTITRADTQPAADLIVRAFDRDLRKAQMLGEAKIDRAGHYEIRYHAKQFISAEARPKAAPDLVIRVSGPDGKVLVESPTRFNAGREETIDLAIPAATPRISEYERYLAAIQPLLKAQGSHARDLSLADLKAEDIPFIAGETGLDPSNLQKLISAQQVGRAFKFKEAAAACYAWFRKGIEENRDAIRLQPPSLLLANLKAAIAEAIVPARLADHMNQIIDGVGSTSWQQAKEVIGQLDLPAQKISQIVEQIDTVEAINDMRLRNLVANGLLTQPQADRLGLTASLHQATQGSIQAVALGLSRPFDSLGQRPPSSAADLSKLTQKEWLDFLQTADVAVPPGLSLEAFAAQLETAAAGAFPTVAMLHRTIRKPDNLGPLLEELTPDSASLEALWHLPMNDEKAEALLSQLTEAQQSAFTAARQIAQRYPGLPAEALTLSNLNTAISGLTTALAEVASLNAGKNLLTLDYTVDSDDLNNLKFDAQSKPLRDQVVRQLRAMRRALAMAGHPADAVLLMGAGYYSAVQVALESKVGLMAKTGLSLEKATRVRDQAVTTSLRAAHAWMAVRDAAGDQKLLKGKAGHGLHGAAAAKIARWSDLFGLADACDCDHCLSVLSPAAYFVDLMYYIETHILNALAGPSDPMHLYARRSDLWELPLTCDNTSTVVPTLDIVNELLETWISAKTPVLNNPINLYTAIAAGSPTLPNFQLPLNFPLERIEILLAHFGLSRDRIVQAAVGQSNVRTRSRLKLWPAEYELIATPQSNHLYFEILYGLSINVPASPDQMITDFIDLSTLQTATGLDRDVLRELVLSDVVSIDGSSLSRVQTELVATPGAVQNNLEQVKYLTSRRLDRLHRIIRLWRRLPWTVAEMDYALERIALRNLASGSTSPAGGVVADLSSTGMDTLMAAIVEILDISDWSGVSLEETMALWDAIPDTGFQGQPALFDRRFNAEPFVTRRGPWPGTSPVILPLPINPAAHTGEADDAARLLGGLGLTQNELAALLAPEGLGPAVAPAQTELALTADTLAILYRHASLCRLLQVRPVDLCRLIRLTPELLPVAGGRTAADQYVRDRSDLFALIRISAWQKSSGYALEDIEWLLDATAVPAGEPAADETAASIVKRISDEKLAVFPATVFTSVGLTEDQSRDVIASLVSSGAVYPQSVADFFRLPAVIADSALAAALTTATTALNFDVAKTAVINLATRLGEFDNTAFTALFVNAARSAQLISDNLETVPPGATSKPFLQVSGTGPTAKYRLNTAWLTAANPAPLVGGADLAQAMVSGLLHALLNQPGPVAIKDTLFTAIGLSEQQSRWLVAANLGNPAGHAFSPAAGGTGLAISAIFLNSPNPHFALDQPLDLPRQQMLALLRQFDPLVVLDRTCSGELGLDPALVTALRLFTSPQQPVDASEVFGEVAGLPTLNLLAGSLLRMQRLFKPPGIDTAAALNILDQWSTFGGQPNGTMLLETLKAVSAYGYWRAYTDPNDPSTATATDADRWSALDALIGNNVWSHFPADEWALVMRCTKEEILSLNTVYGLDAGQWYERFQRRRIPLDMAKRLGVSPDFMALLGLGKAGAGGPKEETVEDLWRAADAIYGAFRAKYPEEEIYQENSEAFEDLIRAKRRDALVAYVRANAVALGIPDGMSLYDYFLMDVDMGGCARTSRLVAALSTLQLYVHRALMNLEPAAFDDDEARAQWYWRKNYRVWEANRKVFLFPENFIEPDLRDDKTPLFNDLEDALLQRRITNIEAEESYAKYLTGYMEVAGLKIVGAFQDDDADVLYLIGTTADEPPVHYLRTLINVERSRDPQSAPTYPLYFTPWEKLNVQIPAKWVSPVVFQRKLMLFWIETATASTTRRIEGQNYFDGYEHKFKVKWTERRANGGWSPPQELYFLDADGRRKAKYADWLVMNIELFDAPNHPFPAPLGVFSYYDYLKELDRDGAAPTMGLFKRPFKAEPRSVQVEQNGANYFALPGSYEAYQAVWHHGAPMDGFTALGWRWEMAFPTIRRHPDLHEELQVAAMNSDVHGFVNLPDRNVPFVAYSSITPSSAALRAAYLIGVLCIDGQQLYMDGRTKAQRVGHHIFESTAESFPVPTQGLLAAADIATFSAILDRLVVNRRADVFLGSETATPFMPDMIVRIATPDGGYADGLVGYGPQKYLFIKLSTTIREALLKQLNTYQLQGLLDADFQKSLAEPALGITTTGVNLRMPPWFESFGYTGPYGIYFRELFFHIPFLLADHLNSRQRFEETKHWYDYIFDPMARDGQPWRYREFATLTPQTLRQMLTDPAALAVYRNDPFNPHAIARLRLSAYQKAVVMKYVDNLLDWGDELFSEFTMESVNEATLLYVLAADILGAKPNLLPKCFQEKSRTYDDIKPSLSTVSDLLIEEMEEMILQLPDDSTSKQINFETPPVKPKFAAALMASGSAGAPAAAESPGLGMDAPPAGPNPMYWSGSGGTPLANLSISGGVVPGAGSTAGGPDAGQYIGGNIDYDREHTGYGASPFGTQINGGGPGTNVIIGQLAGGLPDIKYTLHDVPPPGHNGFNGHSNHVPPTQINPVEYVAAKNIFCFPLNQELLAYYDRVEDRLFKIRNCMDIAGVRRTLALFAPEIDPRLLVRMRAAGLTLEEVLENAAGHVPPYRFTFLLEKARQYAATAQNFGAQLLAAMEKRDGEELAAMRAVQERNLLDMRTQLVQWEIDAANDTLESLRRQQASSQYRQTYFANLISTGLNASEHSQQTYTELASTMGMISSTLELAAAIVGMIPQIQAPTMTGMEASTGGRTVMNVLGRISASTRAAASVFDWAGKASAAQGAFDRRNEEWHHQLELANREVAQLDKQIAAAEIRVSIAERSLEVHQTSMDQAQEAYEFYRDKFTNLGLYTWMSTQLHRLYRLAFDSAWTMARLAEQAMHFERPELRDTVTLSPMPWSGEQAGLLAGESLSLDLQRLELSYLQTNIRQLEVEQSFSLAQFYPDQLVALRQTGECAFNIPEFFFDLYYPGHYFRRIKAVRISLPCVVGPYTSIGATLRMTRSQVRERPNADQPLTEMSLRYAPTICASTAQSDAGLFEFNFRDDRLLPFEGTGAISSWTLSLPKALPSFDYGTITDVIVRLSYTAREDAALRQTIDDTNGALVKRLRQAAPQAALSLRTYFPSVWAQFKQSTDTDGWYGLQIDLDAAHYPFWLRDRLAVQENVSLHALFADPVSPIQAQIGGQPVDMRVMPPDSNASVGRWLNADFPGAKPVTNLSLGNPRLQIELQRNDMKDVIIILGPAN